MSDAGGSEGAMGAWWEELKQQAQAQGREEDCILPLGRPQMGSDEEGEEDEEESEDNGPSLERLRTIPVVICPKAAQKHYEAVAKELDMVGRDEEEDPFRMLDTASSYEGHEILERHLKQIDKLVRKKDWPEAFTYAAALLRAAMEDEFWFMDTDAPEAVEAIQERMDKQWAKLLARSADELGGVSDADKQAVENARDGLSQAIEEYCLVE